jgi:sulfur-oxidizing protein SoxX
MRVAAPFGRAARVATLLLAAALLAAGAARGESGSPADGLAQIPGTFAGDAVRGRAWFASRQTGLCLMCHAGPGSTAAAQGTLAPSLAGVADRLGEAQLRQRVVDPRRAFPDTLMPPYGVSDGLQRVGSAWAGKPMLAPQQIEDVVAYLQTLHGEPGGKP